MFDCNIHGRQLTTVACRCVTSGRAAIAIWLDPVDQRHAGLVLCADCAWLWRSSATIEQSTLTELLAQQCAACVDYHLRPLLLSAYAHERLSELWRERETAFAV